MSGTRFAHYELLRNLGSGGVGEVFVARDDKLGREVALELLPVELGSDKQRRGRLQREARPAAELTHPKVVPLCSVEADARPQLRVVTGWSTATE